MHMLPAPADERARATSSHLRDATRPATDGPTDLSPAPACARGAAPRPSEEGGRPPWNNGRRAFRFLCDLSSRPIF